MIKKLGTLIRNLWPLFVLLGVVGTIISQNLPGQGWLTGWDNLHPEFDFSLNIGRAFSSVWQEYQGVGLLAGMGHAADFFREIFVAGLSFFVPTEWNRFLYHILMIVAGVIGMYVFLFQLVLSKHRLAARQLGALFGALFYLLNLGTILYFYAPFEPYSTFWGMFPWEMYVFIRYLNTPTKKSLVSLFFVNLCAIAQGYVQTLFLVYAICLIIVGSAHVIKSRTRKSLIHVLSAGIVVFLVNAFWVLPSAYFLKKDFGVHDNSQQIRFASDAFYEMNKGRGTLRDFASLKLFYYDFTDFGVNTADFSYFAQAWVKHFDDPLVERLAIGLMTIALLGIFGAFPGRGPFIGIFAIAIVGFLSAAPGFEQFNDVLRHNALFEQLFRNPYTKIIVPTVFVLALFFGNGVSGLIGLFRNKIRRIVTFFLPVTLTLCFSFVFTPLWQGNLFYPAMRISIPQEYFNLFRFMRTDAKPNARIALLPMHYMWGWLNHDWGYRGSGFLWYGIEQPILDRAFDVWSGYNETFYKEFSTALYAQDAKLVQSVVAGYEVQYVVLDESIADAGFDKKLFHFGPTEQIAQELGWVETFHEGFLTVWDTGIDGGEQYVSAPENYAIADGETVKTRKDVIYEEQGTYISVQQEAISLQKSNTLYPFAGLMKEEIKGVEYTDDGIALSAEIPEAGGRELIIPGMQQGQHVEMRYRAHIEGSQVKIDWEPLYVINGQNGPVFPTFVYDIPNNVDNVWVKIGDSKQNAVYLTREQPTKGMAMLTVGDEFPVYVFNGTTNVVDSLQASFMPGFVQQCWTAPGNEPSTARGSLIDGGLRLTTQNASACLPIELAKSPTTELIQTIVHYTSPDGVRPHLCLDEAEEQYECMNEELLDVGGDGFMRTVVSQKGQQYWLDLSSQSVEPHSVERILDYQVPIVARFPLIQSMAMGDDTWAYVLHEMEYDIHKNDIHVTIPSTPRVYDFAELGRRDAFNCDVLKRGSALKDGERYSADHYGAMCDYVEMKNLSTHQPYLIRMRGRTDEGRPMKFFMHNTGSQRNDIEYLLGKNSFDQSFSVLPWDFDGSYTLNIETRSFGQHVSNLLQPVEMRYFPLEILAKAKIGKSNKETVISQDNPLNIINVQKTGTWLYRVETSIGGGLLQLGQGFDNGWIGVGVGEKGGVDLTHVKVNGWANGWIVPAGVEKVVIFYWPQLLEYLGFVLLIVTMVWIIRFRK